jgi:hypothetical protein
MEKTREGSQGKEQNEAAFYPHHELCLFPESREKTWILRIIFLKAIIEELPPINKWGKDCIFMQERQ